MHFYILPVTPIPSDPLFLSLVLGEKGVKSVITRLTGQTATLLQGTTSLTLMIGPLVLSGLPLIG